VHASAAEAPTTLDITFTWTRRSRYAGWSPYVDAPLAETSEAYEVDIYTDSTKASVVRTLSASTNQCVYTNAQIETDFSTGVIEVYADIYQMSSVVGRGYPVPASQARSNFWPYVVSMLHFDGTDGSTTFTDEKGKTWTAVGNAQLDTAISKFGTAALLLDGAGDYITSPDASDYELGSSNWTIDCQIRFSGYAANNGGQFKQSIVSKDVTGGRGFSINVDGTVSSLTGITFLGFQTDAVFTQVDAAYTFSLNTWYHVEVVRSGNLIFIFVDGVLLNTGGTAFSRTIQNTATTLKIGANEFDGTFKYYFNGHIDEFRLTKGVARHTANFTPPTTAYGEI
jgi:hypothetical protein